MADAREMPTKLKAPRMEALAKLQGWRCYYCHIFLVPRGMEAVFCKPTTYMTYSKENRPAFIGAGWKWWILPEGMGEPTLDHKIPVSQGGTHDLDNLVLCCKSCNCRRHTRHSHEEFYKMTAPLRAAHAESLI